MQEKTEEEVSEEIYAFLPELKEKASESYLLRMYIRDWSKMGSFLTREAAVQEQLKQLNRRLELRAGTVWKGAKRGAIKPMGGQEVTVEPLSVLEAELSDCEGKEGFNKGFHGWATPVELENLQGETKTEKDSIDLPSKAAHLTGFVDPTAFRQLLLRHGYHWIDPGAGSLHGAYTHRIQWYCIAQAKNRLLGRDGVKLVELFKALSHDYCLNDGLKKTLWDLLFDMFKPDTPAEDASLYTDSYRSPELLNKFIDHFNNWKTGATTELAILARMIKFSNTRDIKAWEESIRETDMDALGLRTTEKQNAFADGYAVWRKPVNVTTLPKG